MPAPVKICLTCGKVIQPAAQFCPRCGSAFLRISPVPMVIAADASARLAPAAVPCPPVHHWAFILGRLLRQTWDLILAFW